MLSQIALRDRLILVLTVLLAGVAGGLLVFYFISKPGLSGGFNYVEKVTEKQVYLETSSRIDAVKNVSQALVSVVEAGKVDDFLKGNAGSGCYEVSSANCGANGVMITSDGLVLLSWNNLGKDYQKKDWVVLDNEGNSYDLVFTGENDGLGIILGRVVKRGEKALAENLRTRMVGFKTLAFSDENLLKVGQEMLLLKNNLWNNLANVKSDLVMSLKNEILLKDSQVIWDLDQRNGSVVLGSGLTGEGVVIADLGGQLVGYETLNSHNVGQLVSANEIRDMLNKFEQKPDWKSPHFGLKYSVNNKTRMQSRNLPVDYGVIVEDLSSDSVLIKNFGLKVGDLILAVDGQSLLGNSFADLMATKIQGQKVDFSVLRASKKLDQKGSL